MKVNGKGTAVLRAVVTKADGTVVDLGVIDTTHPRWWDVKGRLALRKMRRL